MTVSMIVLFITSIFYNLQIRGGPSMWEFYIRIGSEPLLYLLIGLSVLALLIGFFIPRCLVRLVLAESIAIFGFIFSLFNHTVMNMVPFLLLALALVYWWGPWSQRAGNNRA